MNAKFEKWYREGGNNETYCNRTVAWIGWQAAIQSLEVTDDLVKLALNVRVGAFPIKTAISTEAVEQLLSAVISALKEQAK
jgi:hypothetical protein